MAVAKILRWPSRLAIVARRESDARLADVAQAHAREIAELGELVIGYFHEHYLHEHFDLDCHHRPTRTDHRIQFTKRVHFSGPYTKVPDFEIGKKIKFRSRASPLRGGNPRDFSSYLEIEYVR